MNMFPCLNSFSAQQLLREMSLSSLHKMQSTDIIEMCPWLLLGGAEMIVDICNTSKVREQINHLYPASSTEKTQTVRKRDFCQYQSNQSIEKTENPIQSERELNNTTLILDKSSNSKTAWKFKQHVNRNESCTMSSYSPPFEEDL